MWEHAKSLGLEVVGTQAHARKPELVTFDILQHTLADCVGRAFFEREGQVFVILCAAVFWLGVAPQDAMKKTELAAKHYQQLVSTPRLAAGGAQ